jgi:hypothetical protein
MLAGGRRDRDSKRKYLGVVLDNRGKWDKERGSI